MREVIQERLEKTSEQLALEREERKQKQQGEGVATAAAAAAGDDSVSSKGKKGKGKEESDEIPLDADADVDDPETAREARQPGSGGRGADVFGEYPDEAAARAAFGSKRTLMDPAPPALTVFLERNHLSVSVSASGHTSHILHRRGLRPHVIETSLKETVAAPVLDICRDHSTLRSAQHPMFRIPSAAIAATAQAQLKAARTLEKVAPTVIGPASEVLGLQDSTQPASTPTTTPSTNASSTSTITTSNTTTATSTTAGSADFASNGANAPSTPAPPSSSQTAPATAPATVVGGSPTPRTHARDSSTPSELAASCILHSLSQADPSLRVFDPFCGAGTLVLEGVSRYLGLPARALPRKFAFEHWPQHEPSAYDALTAAWDATHDRAFNAYLSSLKHSRLGALAHPGTSSSSSAEELNKAQGFGPTALSSGIFRFVGSDLRNKSLQAAMHNAKAAGLTPLATFCQGDFEQIMHAGYTVASARALENIELMAQAKQQAAAQLTGEASSSNNQQQQQQQLLQLQQQQQQQKLDALAQTRAQLLAAGASLSPEQVAELASLRRELLTMTAVTQQAPAARKIAGGAHPVVVTGTAMGTEMLPMPDLSGYTIVTNVPWGISDEKPRRSSADVDVDVEARASGKDFPRHYVNTTQQESMADLYFRFGRALSLYGDMFRDVFVLSANALFEKATRAGSVTACSILRKSGIERAPVSWHPLVTFYNNGVKTTLLQLDRGQIQHKDTHQQQQLHESASRVGYLPTRRNTKR